MFRRLCRLTIALSLAFGAVASTANARSFAQPPGTGADPVTVVDDMPSPDGRARRVPAMTEHQRAYVKSILAARRAKNVKAFRDYARRGTYPRNYINNGSLNIWIDGDGHMCAAATMMWKSGAKSLVRQTQEDNNFIRLADVTDGPLLDWILTSGLTHAEVIEIQAPMVGAPNRGIEFPEPGTEDWRIANDRALRAGYEVTLSSLAANRDASLEAALDAIDLRPDLVGKLLQQAKAS
jgi:hypothetical protein